MPVLDVYSEWLTRARLPHLATSCIRIRSHLVKRADKIRRSSFAKLWALKENAVLNQANRNGMISI